MQQDKIVDVQKFIMNDIILLHQTFLLTQHSHHTSVVFKVDWQLLDLQMMAFKAVADNIVDVI
jgi:hypothetical protein